MISRREFSRRLAAAHVELAHNGANAFAQDGTTQPGLKGRMAAHGFHAFPCTPLGGGPSRV
jgi:hypothetical protein